MANSFVASDASPALNTCMVNLVGALPLGADARFQPYISGGWGVRGDIRYFKAFGSSASSVSTGTSTSVTSDTSSTVGTGLLPGLNFWRANLGLAVRF